MIGVCVVIKISFKRRYQVYLGRVKCIDCQSVTPEGIGIIHLLMDQLKIDITKSRFIRMTVVDFKSSELENISLKIMIKY